MAARTRSTVGRPVATTHDDIEQAAFRLFADHGFDGTTLEAIATEVGVGRRTLFRYFESKNDIAWGQFERTLETFRQTLDAMSEELPLWEAVHRGVVEFNRFDLDARPSHRDRMLLILGTPALQAHSVLKYAAWRRVIAEYVADRTGGHPDDALPQVVAQVSLALALTAYTQWLADPAQDLLSLIDRAMAQLREHLAV